MRGGRGEASTLVRQVVIASVLGLLPFALDAGEQAVWPNGTAPHALTRVNAAVRVVTNPGAMFGSAVVGTMDAFGLVGHAYLGQSDENGLPKDWRRVERIRATCSAIANVALFGGFWFILRTRPRSSWSWKLAVGVLTAWLLTSVPLAVLGAAWMVLGP